MAPDTAAPGQGRAGACRATALRSSRNGAPFRGMSRDPCPRYRPEPVQRQVARQSHRLGHEGIAQQVLEAQLDAPPSPARLPVFEALHIGHASVGGSEHIEPSPHEAAGRVGGRARRPGTCRMQPRTPHTGNGPSRGYCSTFRKVTAIPAAAPDAVVLSVRRVGRQRDWRCCGARTTRLSAARDGVDRDAAVAAGDAPWPWMLPLDGKLAKPVAVFRKTATVSW